MVKEKFKIVAKFLNEAGYTTQAFFDLLITSALLHKYSCLKTLAIPITPKLINDAVFDLTDHETVEIYGTELKLDGQKFKEIVITTIVAKMFKRDLCPPDKILFMAIPEKRESCDSALIVVDPDGFRTKDNKDFEITKEYDGAFFQIKEYYNYESWLNSEEILKPQEIKSELFKIEKLKNYDEAIIIYIREFTNMHSAKVEQILEPLKDKKIYIVAHTNRPPVIDDKKIPLKEGNLNFMVSDLWAGKHHLVFFPKPSSFISSSNLKRHLDFIISENYNLKIR